MAVMNGLNKPFFGQHITFDAACLLSPTLPEVLSELRMTLPEVLSDLRMTLAENRSPLFGVMR